MSDWLKVLLGAAVGFTFGLLSEPIKFWIANQLKRRQARKLLYSEFAKTLTVLRMLAEKDQEGYFEKASDEDIESANGNLERLNELIAADLFEYYFEKEKILYYNMADARIMRGVNRSIREEFTPTLTLDEAIAQSGAIWAAILTAFAADLEVDMKLLNKLTTFHETRSGGVIKRIDVASEYFLRKR